MKKYDSNPGFNCSVILDNYSSQAFCVSVYYYYGSVNINNLLAVIISDCSLCTRPCAKEQFLPHKAYCES